MGQGNGIFSGHRGALADHCPSGNKGSAREGLLSPFPRDGGAEPGRCRAETSPWFGISVTAPSPSPAERRSLHCSRTDFLFQLGYFLPASRAAALCAQPGCPCAPKIDLSLHCWTPVLTEWDGGTQHHTPPQPRGSSCPACRDTPVGFPCWGSRAEGKSLPSPGQQCSTAQTCCGSTGAPGERGEPVGAVLQGLSG